MPVDPELTISLRPRYDVVTERDAADRQQHAGNCAKALINLKSAEKVLTKYARDVRRAADAAVTAARADGLDVLVDRAGLRTTHACLLTQEAWKEAALHVFAVVTIRHTSFYVRSTTSTIFVEEPADIAEELRDFREEQRERQHRMAELEKQGADLGIDAITLDLLAAHGLDTTGTMTEAWKKQCLNLTVRHLGEDARLTLVTSDAKVAASIVLPEAYWNGRHLWFVNDERDGDHTGLVGKALGELVRHPIFAKRPIASVKRRGLNHIPFDLSDKMLFDADTGRFWRKERLAA